MFTANIVVYLIEEYASPDVIGIAASTPLS
jgi:hypothetical protein